MSKNTLKNYKFWLSNAPSSVKEDIQNFTQKEVENFFSKDIEFGTAGMRGHMEWGTNAINVYTIARASYAYGKLLIKKYATLASKYGIIIAHDNRRMRNEFSMISAKVLSAMGIKIYLFNNNELQPTPLLSFTIAQNKFVGGINITASHNPSSDNGFKIYNADGIQCSEEDTNYIQSIFKEIDYFNIPTSEENIYLLSKKYVKDYVKHVMKNIPFTKNVNRKDLSIVFTSQHGTSFELAKTFSKLMKVNFIPVESQCYPDENFINTKNPNPQAIESYDEARIVAEDNNANIIFSTDPDADRFGVMIKRKGKWRLISGNELPLIQLLYKLTMLKEMGKLEPHQFIVRSIVTSNLGDKIAKSFGVDVYKTHTGFKNIISKALEIERTTKKECLFAWEESYGSTIRTFTRDKDSFQALVQVIEMTQYYLDKNKTLLDVLEDIYKKYGRYEMFQIQKKFDGTQGFKKMQSIINNFRKLNKIGKHKIKETIDFQHGYKDLLPQNFVMAILPNDSWVCLRPSGTEPILRIYFDIHEYKASEIASVFDNIN